MLAKSTEKPCFYINVEPKGVGKYQVDYNGRPYLQREPETVNLDSNNESLVAINLGNQIAQITAKNDDFGMAINNDEEEEVIDLLGEELQLEEVADIEDISNTERPAPSNPPSSPLNQLTAPSQPTGLQLLSQGPRAPGVGSQYYQIKKVLQGLRSSQATSWQPAISFN